MPQKICNLIDGFALVVSLKKGTIAELKERLSPEIVDRLVEQKWVLFDMLKINWYLTSEGIKQSKIYRKPI